MRETVHAAPVGGYSFTPCCDRTMQELPRYDRISRLQHEVTCNKLSDEELWLLAGGSAGGSGQNTEQLMYEMAVSVRSLYGPGLSLQEAFQHVQTAVWELAPSRRPDECWPAALLVQITSRAGELAR
ncbi:MAG TPA: hypothetical protein VHO01_04650 [Jatrophihabitans sp.]|nr:hypothetical protein [Jatrophihabitans sp.]